MCRHVGYLGPAVPLTELLLAPPHSLLHQSYAPQDMRHGGTINADGFGAGWFAPGEKSPVRYRRDVPMWTDAAYEQNAVVHRFLNRTNILLNDPDAIRHVLVDNWQNYRRSPASIRILRPITGQGLLLSEGDDWRLQRRTVAPALAPRTLPVLARHIVACADEAIPALDAECNLLAAMQNLTLEIAGR